MQLRNRTPNHGVKPMLERIVNQYPAKGLGQARERRPLQLVLRSVARNVETHRLPIPLPETHTHGQPPLRQHQNLLAYRGTRCQSY